MLLTIKLDIPIKVGMQGYQDTPEIGNEFDLNTDQIISIQKKANPRNKAIMVSTPVRTFIFEGLGDTEIDILHHELKKAIRTKKDYLTRENGIIQSGVYN